MPGVPPTLCLAVEPGLPGPSALAGLSSDTGGRTTTSPEAAQGVSGRAGAQPASGVTLGLVFRSVDCGLCPRHLTHVTRTPTVTLPAVRRPRYAEKDLSSQKQGVTGRQPMESTWPDRPGPALPLPTPSLDSVP